MPQNAKVLNKFLQVEKTRMPQHLIFAKITLRQKICSLVLIDERFLDKT